jgi:predicted RNA-binding Zn ribbon-like protein
MSDAVSRDVDPGHEPDHQFELIAGAACLDFANTVSGRRRHTIHEHLRTFADLARWALAADLYTADEAERLIERAVRRPMEAEAVLARARALRGAIYAIFTALIDESGPPASAVDTLNAELAPALAHLALVPDATGFRWGWVAADGALDSILWRVARSAAELLTSPAMQSVRQCAGETCDWLFVDTTRNRSRRWCDMGGCGNRAKVRRHRARQGGDVRQQIVRGETSGETSGETN